MSEQLAAFDLSPFSGSVLACEPAAWRGYRSTLDAIASGRVQIAASSAARPSRTATQSRIGVIEVRGYLTDHSNWLSDCLNWSTYDEIGTAADQFAADPDVSAVVVTADSGGGDVMGCQECAGRIAALAQKKPVVGFVNAFCCSSAFWLLSQTNRLLMMPSGMTGSVGVLLVHTSFAGANAQAGIETTYVVSSGSPKKSEGNPDFPLDADAREYMIRQLDQYFATFAAAVARGRRTTTAAVERDYGRGRAMGSADALRVGAVCGTATTLLEVISRAAAGEGQPKRTSASAQMLRNYEALARLKAEVRADELASTTTISASRHSVASATGRTMTAAEAKAVIDAYK
jgi:ClpP class serine protease